MIIHTIPDILHVWFVHLMPGNALPSVHLLLAWYQFIWLAPLIYNKLLNKAHFSLRSMQALPQGSLFNVHPHLHGLIPAGIMKDGVFYEQTNISAPVIAEIFRARLLTVLLEQGVITQELINMLMCWNHHSGFNIHVRGEIDGADGDAIENIARYMSRAAISVDRVEFNPEDNTLTIYERKDRPPSGMYRTYTIMEFMALLAAHIPSPYESLVYYYGVYSSSHLGIKFRTGEGRRGERTSVIRVSRYKRQKAPAEQVPHGLV